MADSQKIHDLMLHKSKDRTSCLGLLSVLLYIQHPQLIYFFLEKGIDDGNIGSNIQKFDVTALTTRIWPHYTARSPARSHAVARDFQDEKFRFFLPEIRTCPAAAHEVPNYSDEVIFPFLDERRLSQEGSFGKVYSFRIDPEYIKSQNISEQQKLVRKEVDCNITGLEESELSTLIQVQSLNDPNVVKLLAAYRHGTRLNLIFAEATTNLDVYLRSDSQIWPKSSPAMEYHPIWWNMLDIMKALQRFGNGIKCSVSGKYLKGYHFDLKPANILVDESNNKVSFLIADFGFARFAERSKLTTKGFTSAYAPPEASHRSGQHNQNYDVWSIGCVLLEALAYVLEGPAGVQNLDDLRLDEDRERNFTDDSFWEAKGPKSYILKPQISRWMSQVVQRMNTGSKQRASFTNSILKLIRSMLEVDARDRIDIQTTFCRMNALLAPFRPQGSTGSSTPTMHAEASGDEVELGAEELSKIRGVVCLYGDWWDDDCCINIYEDYKGCIRIRLHSARQSKTILIGSREQASLIPYPLSDAHRLTVISATLAADIELYFRTSKDALVLQSVIVGQHMTSFNPGTRGLDLDGAISCQLVRGSSKLITCMHSGRSRSGTVVMKARHVEIWTEKSYKDPQAWAKIRPRKNSPRTPFGRASPRRIVFFCEDCIIFLTLAKNSRLQKSTGKSNSKSHAIVPMDTSASSRDPTFPIAILPARSSLRHPEIPFDREKFEAKLQATSVECLALDFSFRDIDDASIFARRYSLAKKRWEDESRLLLDAVNFGGEERGWTPLYYCEKTSDGPV